MKLVTFYPQILPSPSSAFLAATVDARVIHGMTRDTLRALSLGRRDGGAITSCSGCDGNPVRKYCCAAYYKTDPPPKYTDNKDDCPNGDVTTGESCIDCLSCSGNRCGQEGYTCGSNDAGSCCIPPKGKSKYLWYCNACADCPSDYQTASYEVLQSVCHACSGNEKRGTDCF